MMKKNPAGSYLVAAVRTQDYEGLEEMLRSGTAPDARERDGRTALMEPTMKDDRRAAEMLLNSGANPDAQDTRGFSALHFAASDYLPGMASLLLANGASVDLRERNGNTPLFRAVFDSRGRGDVIRVLLQHGADKHLSNHHGVSPADLAETIANYDVRQFMG